MKVRGFFIFHRLIDLGYSYKGEFKLDKRTGKGVLSWPDGEKYDGFFQDDRLEGTGVYYYANGDRYEGLFQNGMKHGRGIYHFSNNDRYPRYFLLSSPWSHVDGSQICW